MEALNECMFCRHINMWAFIFPDNVKSVSEVIDVFIGYFVLRLAKLVSSKVIYNIKIDPVLA